MKPLGSTDQKRLNREWRRRTGGRVALLLDDVQAPYNVGAIIRTAAAFRVERLYLCGATPAPGHPKAARTALGTERLVPWEAVPDVQVAVAAAHASGLAVVGLELAGGAVPLPEAAWASGGACFAFGHEQRGLSPACLAGCDIVAYVPTPGKVGSLNVAAAVAVALYEARRREWATPTGPEAPQHPPPGRWTT
ncbi:MAG: TrmH family RNA methyltransferase [Acidimicrobiales bacterium]